MTLLLIALSVVFYYFTHNLIATVGFFFFLIFAVIWLSEHIDDIFV